MSHTLQDAARNGSVDYLRFLGALAIVWFHLPMPGGPTALAALHLFLLLQVYYGAGRPLEGQIPRLLTPWIGWSVFYALASIAQALVQNRPVAEEFAPWMLLTGPALHLWYLPFSLLAVAVTGWALRALSWPVIYALTGGVMLLSVWLSAVGPWPIPLAQWLSVGPAVAAGLCLLGPVSPVLLALVLCPSLAVLVFGLGWVDAAWQSLIALTLVVLALRLPLASTALSRRLSALSLGIYLVHPAVYAVLLMVVTPPLWALYGAVVLISVALTEALRRIAPRFV